MNHPRQEISKGGSGTFRSYGVGFILSFLLTTLSFLLVSAKLLTGQILLYTLAALAFIQATCQLLFFLRLGQKGKRFETVVFYFMLLVLLIIVIGSLWIMSDLNHRMMPDMSHE